MSATKSVRIGVHGDPLPEGKLDLPELGEVPRPEELAWARAFVAQRRWRAAVTDPAPVPHEYTVRDWCPSESDQQDFVCRTRLTWTPDWRQDEPPRRCQDGNAET